MSVEGSRGRLVDGVLFDVDDTLVDTRSAFVAAMAAVGRHYVPDADQALLDRMLQRWRSDPEGHYGRYTRGEVDYLTQRRARAEDLHASVGAAALDDEGFARWNEVFEAAFSSAWGALHDASAVVDRLLGAGLVVGALTNAAVAYQTGKLERAGLVGRVPLLVGVDTLGVGKPDPRVFLEACRLLGTDPARTAYVGDELDVDARAAVAAGLVGVWVDRPGTGRYVVDDAQVDAARAEGVHVVGSLSAVPDLLGVA